MHTHITDISDCNFAGLTCITLGDISLAQVGALGKDENALRLVAVNVRQHRDHVLHRRNVLTSNRRV